MPDSFGGAGGFEGGQSPGNGAQVVEDTPDPDDQINDSPHLPAADITAFAAPVPFEMA